MFALLNALNSITRNSEFTKKLHKFLDVSNVLVLSLQKYNFFEKNYYKEKISINYFADNLFSDFDFNENIALCLYPVSLIKNLINTVNYIRKFSPEILANEYSSSRLTTYFALIYSCTPNVIKNPHLRSEIFDILIHLLVVHNEEKNRRKIFLLIFQFLIY